MAKKILLAKGNIRREFGERAAKIAVEFLGWVEVHPSIRPEEVLTKTKPPEITKPVKLIQPPITEEAPVVEKEEIKVVKKRRPRKK